MVRERVPRPAESNPHAIARPPQSRYPRRRQPRETPGGIQAYVALFALASVHNARSICWVPCPPDTCRSGALISPGPQRYDNRRNATTSLNQALPRAGKCPRTRGRPTVDARSVITSGLARSHCAGSRVGRVVVVVQCVYERYRRTMSGASRMRYVIDRSSRPASSGDSRSVGAPCSERCLGPLRGTRPQSLPFGDRASGSSCWRVDR